MVDPNILSESLAQAISRYVTGVHFFNVRYTKRLPFLSKNDIEDGNR